MNNIRVFRIVDGRAGHETISQGVIDALSSSANVSSFDLMAKPRLKLFIRIFVILINAGIIHKGLPKNVLRTLCYLFFSVEQRTDPCDVIVSSGGRTLIPAILSSWIHRRPVIFCGSLRRLEPRHIDIVITSDPTLTCDNKVYTEFPPVKIPSSNDKKSKFKDNNTWSLLIGGDGAGFKYSPKEAEWFISKLIEKARINEKKLNITTSRRTNKHIDRIVDRLFKENEDIVETCVIYNRNPTPVVEDYLRKSELIFVTADSGSMIVESVVSRSMVVVVYPDHSQPSKFYQKYLDNMIKNKRIHFMKLQDIENFEIDKIKLEALPEDWYNDFTRELKKRLELKIQKHEGII